MEADQLITALALLIGSTIAYVGWLWFQSAFPG